MTPRFFPLAATAFAVLAALPAQADDSNLETLTIFGDAEAVKTVPGSAAYLGEEALEKFDYTDIMRVLTAVPGVYVSEEDGFGLRPNIGMRGSSQSRSEKITVMEDGVLVAPAPYASPAAYYFPTIGRMQAVEVFKGTSAVRYGPRTTGGVLNLVSRQVPDETAASVNLAYGSDNYIKAHGWAGGGSERLSGLVEWMHYQSDGFKTINGSGNDTGFNKDDVVLKVRSRSDASARIQQETEFKFHYANEDSDETYLGITDEDYRQDPYQRYSASQKDNMDSERFGYQLNHAAQLTPGLAWHSAIYYNDFARNWYKTGSGIVEEASLWDRDPAGQLPQSVDVKANNREYSAWGIQTQGEQAVGDHTVTFGVRYHEDEMDRFQWVDQYELGPDQLMRLTEAGIPGTDSNRIDSADAWAGFVSAELRFGDVRVDTGVRYEHVETLRRDWGKADPGRTQTPARKSNSVDGLMPALGVSYQISDDWLILAGVQKGFAPPAPGNNSAEEEESWNYEAGFRFNNGPFSVEAIGFLSDYDNMHGNCTAAQGCDEANIGDQENAGEVRIQGLEFSADLRPQAAGLTWPLGLRYTLSDSEFQNSFSSDLETWGEVTAGDEMPYVPEHLVQITAGVEGERWDLNLLGRYQSDVRTVAGAGAIPTAELLPSRWILDLSAHYRFDERQKIYVTVDNLLDETYIATRIHGGIQTGKPLSAIIGYQYDF
ncbi:TonB-dependent receptor family protein [Ferrimonas gelatinilytica]|uniref:TonB-dependent receptor n=1 Tax=Ferrimonas gelatinilytica TaxID=1255257 RepID=A0ABP9S2N7_9GAMM